MLAPVHSLLTADAAVVALVPAARICRTHAGESPTAPYVVWHTIDGQPANYLAGRPGLDAHRVQVDAWATTAAQAKQVAAAVRNALELHAVCVGFFDDYDPETRLYRFSSDWRFQTPR